jgi:GNAT superfamily N-acetyltransferase
LSEKEAESVLPAGVVIALNTAQTQEEMQAVITGLRAYNASKAGTAEYAEWGVYVRDSGGAIKGGLLAETGRGWLHISILWLDESLRGQGLGTRLMEIAETEARQRDCHHVYLDTFDYQARPFYESLGYTVFGTLEDYPLGHQRFFLQKRL